MADPLTTKRLDDPRTIKALAHPLRLRLLGQLRITGPATATTLARAVGEGVASVSYHLRQLGEHGFIEEAAELKRDGRERWWRASHSTTSWSTVDFLDSPERLATEAALTREVLRVYAGVAQRWLDERAEWPAEWIDSSDMSDDVVRLTPDELKAMVAELHAVLARYNERPAQEGAETVHVILQAYPFKAAP